MISCSGLRQRLTYKRLLLPEISVTRFGKNSPLWKNLGLGQFFEGLFTIWQFWTYFGKTLNLLRQILFTFGQFSFIVNGQMLTNYPVIWSHCCRRLMSRLYRSNSISLFSKWANPGLFLFFSTQISQKKPVDVNGIRTRIVGVEGKLADHLTTTTRQFRF